jgi:hypothetical protein
MSKSTYDKRARRVSALSGITIAAALALWWLGSSRLALDDGADASRPAGQALHALWLVRAMVLALLSVRVAALHGWWAGAGAGLALVAPAWPVMVLAWSASTVPLVPVVLAEWLLLVACGALPLLGLGLRRLLRQAPLAEAAATLVGVVLVAVLWFTRGLWALSAA